MSLISGRSGTTKPPRHLGTIGNFGSVSDSDLNVDPEGNLKLTLLAGCHIVVSFDPGLFYEKNRE
jgi:hypothetical protein